MSLTPPVNRQIIGWHKLCFIAISAVTIPTLIGCIRPAPGTELRRDGDEIVACGRLFHTGTPVVLWTDPHGYDGYRAEYRFLDPSDPRSNKLKAAGQRYGTLRKHLPDELGTSVRERGWKLDELREHVDLFVMHYDVCGTARRCFKVLHDLRGLSVHFLLDVDGTVYQTLDLKERAYHAGTFNDRSIGIEIANMGAYPDPVELDAWYQQQNGITVFDPPATNGKTGILTPDFVARPSRSKLCVGKIHDRQLHQYDLTDAQYRALAKLTAAVSRVLPRIQLDAPCTEDGLIRMDMLTPDEVASFSGIVGHYHLTERKVDPGPAFDWDRILNESRRWR